VTKKEKQTKEIKKGKEKAKNKVENKSRR